MPTHVDSVSSPRPLGRNRVVATILVLMMLGLAVRLVNVQVVAHESLDGRALRQQARREPIPARPGDVLDAHGKLLATSVDVYSLYADPKAIQQRRDFADSLAVALGLDRDRLLEQLESHAGKHFLWIKRRLTEDEIRAVRELKWPANWLGFRREMDRAYPAGSLASHVIGLRDIDGVGRDGIERQFDSLLRGEPGYQIVGRDAAGRPLALQEHLTKPPTAGASIVLTIDSTIQTHVERTLDEVVRRWKPASATAIVMNPRTGEILALANRPAVDLAAPSAASTDAWVNRAISDAYEPGSTFKPFIVASALDRDVIKPDDEIDCHNGSYKMGPRVLHSHHHNGLLTVPEIVSRSDNIGMAVIGQKLTNEGIFRAVQSFGFGHATGIELPGEAAGKVRPLRDWTPYYSTGSVPMGQELAVTPMQLITAFAAIANGGELVRPRVVRAVIGPDGRTVHVFDQPEVVHRAIRAETAAFMVDPVLLNVVDDSAHGTGKRAQLAGYSIFGKTGTAQKQAGAGGYAPGRHVSSFIGGAPASNPELVALVVVNDPDPTVSKEHYGGEVAAPPTRDILQHALVRLRIQPDRDIAARPRDKSHSRAAESRVTD